ncbi:MAG: hypothetical protein ACLFQJ_06260 [Campylobacterales bacterium]
MKSFLKIATVGLLSVLLLAGCRTATVQNVEHQNVVANKKVTLDEVGDAVVRAGTGLGWVMKKKKPGHIVGSLFLRGHVAVVDITYDTKEYSINYNRSENLKYNPEDKTIHKNYNGWIKNLNSAIMSQLSALQ